MHHIHRTGAFALPVLLAALALPQQAAAQSEDYRQIVTEVRACAAIADVAARVACYDAASAPPSNQGPAAVTVRAAAPLPPTAPQAPRGFGSETVAQPRQSSAANQEVDELVAQVTSIRQVQPGIAQLTLADGAQWRFVDAASYSYDLPHGGDTVRLQRGSMGSYYLHFKGQRALRIQRVR